MNSTDPLDFYQNDKVSGEIKIFPHMQTLIEISFFYSSPGNWLSKFYVFSTMTSYNL